MERKYIELILKLLPTAIIQVKDIPETQELLKALSNKLKSVDPPSEEGGLADLFKD
jgi:hypothetical protein